MFDFRIAYMYSGFAGYGMSSVAVLYLLIYVFYIQ